MSKLKLIFDSHYCKTAFFLSAGAMITLLPKTLFHGFIAVPAIFYIILFSLNITCLIRHTKDRAKAASKNSAVSFAATLIGITALNTCGVGAPMCGATIGIGLFSTVLPNAFLGILTRYSTWLLIGALILQLYSLYSMKCFKANIQLKQA